MVPLTFLNTRDYNDPNQLALPWQGLKFVVHNNWCVHIKHTLVKQLPHGILIRVLKDIPGFNHPSSIGINFLTGLARHLSVPSLCVNGFVVFQLTVMHTQLNLPILIVSRS